MQPQGGSWQGFLLPPGESVEGAFIENPCVGSKDLFAVLDKVPDPPPGCRLPPDAESGEFYRHASAEGAFGCPLQPMTIRRKLAELAERLDSLNRRTLEEAFERGSN